MFLYSVREARVSREWSAHLVPWFHWYPATGTGSCHVRVSGDVGRETVRGLMWLASRASYCISSDRCTHTRTRTHIALTQRRHRDQRLHLAPSSHILTYPAKPHRYMPTATIQTIAALLCFTTCIRYAALIPARSLGCQDVHASDAQHMPDVFQRKTAKDPRIKDYGRLMSQRSRAMLMHVDHSSL
jgi:hypothetical protein